MSLPVVSSKLMSSITNITGPEPHTADKAWPIEDQFIGIELEMEEVALGSVRGWTSKDDHSLRNGIEYVTAGPKMGKGLTSAVNSICTAFSKQKNLSEARSFRTSTHIHLDCTRTEPYSNGMSPDTLSSIHSLLVCYYALEDLFYAVAGEDRRYSGFCTPLADNHVELAKFLAADVDHVMSKYAGGGTNRYYGLNWQSLYTFGTLEFRHAPLFTTKKELTDWISAIMKLKEFTYGNLLGRYPKYDFFKSPSGIKEAAAHVFSAYDVMGKLDMQHISTRLQRLYTSVHAMHELASRPVRSKYKLPPIRTWGSDDARREDDLLQSVMQTNVEALRRDADMAAMARAAEAQITLDNVRAAARAVMPQVVRSQDGRTFELANPASAAATDGFGSF